MSQLRYHLTLKSSNEKTGPIPVSTSPGATCPSSCELKDGGCYAENFPMSLHWSKVSEGKRGVTWEEFLLQIHGLPTGQLWRHNQAGDLPGQSDEIDACMLFDLIDANAGKRGFTYTHKHSNPENRGLIKIANQSGFTVNLSADRIDQVYEMLRWDIGPVVVVIPKFLRSPSLPEGDTIVMCPATKPKSTTTCEACGMCAVASRKFVIAFPAHGAKADKITERILPKLF